MSITHGKPFAARISFLLILFCTSQHLLYAQCTASGPRSASNAASVSFAGSNFNFSAVNNIFSSDDSRASSSGLITLFNGETEYLQATNFGFSIPPTAIICGIVVEAEKSATGIGSVFGIGLSYVSDHSVRLVRNGVVTGNNKATAAHWTSSETYHSYGGNSDIWGYGWTAADINSSNFGIAFSANIAGLAMLIPDVRIDHIRITIHYYVALLPVRLISFNAAVTKDKTALIEWQTTIDKSSVLYSVERSGDGITWETVNGKLYHSSLPGRNAYRIEDVKPYTGQSFYRLHISDVSGETSYSAARPVYMSNLGKVKVFPNPFTDRLPFQISVPTIKLPSPT